MADTKPIALATIAEAYLLILTNKDLHGRKGCLVAIVRGTKVEEVNEALRKIPLPLRETVQTITHDLDDSMAQIAMQFRGMYEHGKTKDGAREKLLEWYERVEALLAMFPTFETPLQTIQLHEETILREFQCEGEELPCAPERSTRCEILPLPPCKAVRLKCCLIIFLHQDSD